MLVRVVSTAQSDGNVHYCRTKLGTKNIGKMSDAVFCSLLLQFSSGILRQLNINMRKKRQRGQFISSILELPGQTS